MKLFFYSEATEMSNRIGLDQKLSVLQEADVFRKWYSLDDHRICVLCDRVISGRMIDVWQDKRGTYKLHCPTPGCSASPHDWFYHGAAHLVSGRLTETPAPAMGFGLSAS